MSVGNGRRAMAIVAALCACVAITGCGSDDQSAKSDSASQSASKEPYKIGATIFLTGLGASAGELWRNGALLATEEINAAGGIDGRKVEFTVEDTGTDTAKSVTAFSKLASRDKVPAVLSGGSTAVLAQAPVATRTKTVLLNAAAQSPALRGVSPFVFSAINASDLESKELVAYAAKQGVKKGVVVYQNDASGEGNGKALEASMKENGIEVQAMLQQNQEDKDYRSLVARLKSLDPDAVFLASSLEPAGFLLKQSKDGGLDTQWYGLSLVFTDAVTKVAGKDGVEGMITIKSNYVVNTDEGKAKGFVDAYKKRFNSDPDEYAAHFYDAIYLIKHAVETGGGDNGEALAKSLAAVNEAAPFTGATGPIAFDSGHMISQPNVILKVHDGELVPVEN